MKLLRDMSIRRKQVLLMVLTSTVALMLACAAFMVNDARQFRGEMTERLASLAGVLGNNLTAAIDFNDPAAAAETLGALRSEPNIVQAHVHTPGGGEFATYLRTGARPPAEIDPEADSHIFVDQHLHVFRPIVWGSETIGTIELVTDLDELNQRMRHYAGIAAGVLGVSLLVSLVLSSHLQRLISDPVLHLARIARIVAKERNFSVRAEKTSNDEMGQLIDGFNEMLGQIELRDDALRTARDTLERRVEERTAALRHAQEESARERARFKFIFESVPVGISWLVPGDESTHLVNPAHERITSVSAEESRLPGAFARVSHPEDYARQRELTDKFTRGEIDRYSVEKRYLHPDGRVVWAVFSSRMFTDPVSEKKQSVSTLVDITELKRSEADLAYERDLLRALLDTCPDAIYFKDRDSRFLRCSHSMARTQKFASTDQLIGRSDVDFFDPELARAARADEQEIMRTGVAMIDKTERAVGADGRVTWTLTSKMPLRNVHGETIGSMGMSKDITPIKDAEEKIAATHRQLVKISRHAGMAEVATGVLHNVGNVLNSVNVSTTVVAERLHQSELGNLQKVCALLRAAADDLPGFFARDPRGGKLPGFLETLHEHLAIEQREILQEVEQLRTNIEHIKEIVAMQQNYARVSGVIEIIAAADLVNDAVRMNDAALARHGVRVVRDFQASPAIAVEKHKVLQILINLIRNAKYACDDSGRPDKVLTLRVTGDEERVRIAVVDNGVGIAPENLTRIFSHGFTTRKNGHGFGLHSGALAAREMSGTLLAESDGPGHGAAFVLELPCNSRSPL